MNQGYGRPEHVSVDMPQGGYGQPYNNNNNNNNKPNLFGQSAYPNPLMFQKPMMGMGPMGGGDGATNLSADLDVQIRHGFIRKVYGILSVQLIITCFIAGFLGFEENSRAFLQRNIWVFFLALALSFALLCVLSCFTKVARSYPTNYILLFVFTICEGVVIGAVAGTYDLDVVVYAAVITTGVVIACTIFAVQTKIDFTGLGIYLMVAVVVLLLFGLLAAIFRSNVARLVYAALGALLFSVFLIHDTQLIVGGKHRKHQYSLDDYVFAALSLYIDIINIFMFLLEIVNRST